MKSAIDKILGYFNTYYDRYRYEFYLVLLSILAFIVHLHLASTLNLGNDEAHYYVWSLKPSLGYLDDAPFVGYVIYFFTGLFGKSELNVRLGAVIFSFLDGFLIYYLSYSLFKNKRASFFAFLFFLSAVIFSAVLSVMMLPDAPLLFFYLCFLILFYKAANGSSNNIKKGSDLKSDHFFRNNLILWMLTGLFLGLAFLSKYTAALIPPSVLLYLLVSKKNRAVLKTFYPYLALAAALLVFSPVIYWNITHNLMSFKFQLSHGFSHPKPGISLFIQGWLGQFLVVTPFIYLFLIGTFVYSLKFILFKKRHDLNIKWSDFKSDPFIDNLKAESYADIAEGFLYSVCLSFPILVFFIINGYSHRILVHWPDIGYMSAFSIMGYVADKISFGKNNVKSVNKLKHAPAAKAIARAVPTRFSGKVSKQTKFSEAVIYKIIVYFTIFSGFFLSFVLYNQIYYNSIPIGKIIRYIDKEKNLRRHWIFSLIPHIPGKPKTADIANDLFGWRKGARYIGAVYEGYEAVYHPLFVLTHHYAIADELVYYGGYKPALNIYNISGFLNQYDLWQNLNKINGKDCIFIMDNKYMINPMRTYKKDFKSIKKIGRLDIYIKFRPVRVYYLYLMKDFNAKRAIRHIKKRMF